MLPCSLNTTTPPIRRAGRAFNGVASDVIARDSIGNLDENTYKPKKRMAVRP
jgi:hypothetical protein